MNRMYCNEDGMKCGEGETPTHELVNVRQADGSLTTKMIPIQKG
jgi:hypothetical protein